MHKLKAPIRRFLPLLIGSVAVFTASSAFAQNGALNQLLTQYQNATTQWMGQIMGYATNLFVALAAIEFSWTAVVLVLEQRELECWVAAFIKKLMGISFFYALLLKGPQWIPAIINSFMQIGQNVGNTGTLTPDGILNLGVQLGGQILQAAGNIFTGINLLNWVTYIPKIQWALLLGAIAVVVILCYVAIAIQFMMAQIEGFIVISAGMIYMGFGGSRWTSSYVERFLGTAVSTGIRLMVFFLIIGLGQTLTQGAWTQGATKVANEVSGSNYFQAATDAFFLTASIIIFSVLAFRLPKVVGAVISGSPSLSGGDLAGTAGTLVGGAATVASLVAAPELLAAKAGASAAGAGAEAGGVMSAGKTADAGGGSMKGMSGVSSMGSSAKDASNPPPPSRGRNAASNQQASAASSSSAGSPNSLSRSSSSASSAAPGMRTNAADQAPPPGVSINRTPSSAPVSQFRPGVGNGVNTNGAVVNGAGVGGSRVSAQAPSTSSPSSGGVSSGGGGIDAAPPSASSSADGLLLSHHRQHLRRFRSQSGVLFREVQRHPHRPPMILHQPVRHRVGHQKPVLFRIWLKELARPRTCCTRCKAASIRLKTMEVELR